jgi:hypothetical protein
MVRTANVFFCSAYSANSVDLIPYTLFLVLQVVFVTQQQLTSEELICKQSQKSRAPKHKLRCMHALLLAASGVRFDQFSNILFYLILNAKK